MHMLHGHGIPSMTFRALLFTVGLAMLCGGPSFAADIHVRLVEIRNGRPAGGEKIGLYLGDASRPSTQRVEAKTSPDGIAVFHLPEHKPGQIGVDSENGHIRACSGPFMLSTFEVLQKGVVSKIEDRPDCTDKRNAKILRQFKEKPGEIVVFVRRLRWWERGLR